MASDRHVQTNIHAEGLTCQCYQTWLPGKSPNYMCFLAGEIIYRWGIVHSFHSHVRLLDDKCIGDTLPKFNDILLHPVVFFWQMFTGNAPLAWLEWSQRPPKFANCSPVKGDSWRKAHLPTSKHATTSKWKNMVYNGIYIYRFYIV